MILTAEREVTDLPGSDMSEHKCAHIFRDGNTKFNYCPLCGMRLDSLYSFQKGEYVWVLDNIDTPEVLKAKITSVNTLDYGIMYNLVCDDGMNLGEWPAGTIFKTREDLVSFYTKILNNESIEENGKD